MDILLWIAIGLLAYAFYKWATNNNDYFIKKGIAFSKPRFLLGANTTVITRHLTMPEYMSNLYNEFPDQKISGVYAFRLPIFMLRDPELIKQVAIKDFDHFTDHLTLVIDPSVDPLFGSSLFSMTGHKWKEMRSNLSPIFTGSKMRQMFGAVSECGAKMAATFMENAKKEGAQTHEMKDVFTRFTNDVIASTAFGIEVNSFEDRENEFYKLGLRVVNFQTFWNTLKLIGLLMSPALMKYFKIPFFDKEASAYFKNIITNNFETREKHNIVRNDLIQLLMQLKKGKSIQEDEKEEPTVDGFATVEESEIGKRVVQRQWTHDELVAQCFIFFLGGFDTTSTHLSFLAYELAINPDIQEKLYEEVHASNADLGGKNLTYDALTKMKYLDMVASEALRKWPPLPVTDRFCVKDYQLKFDGVPEITIEKGRHCWFPIYGLHYDPKYWENPQKFDPERFSDENKGSINTGAYMPFGVGPRNCIGSRFALMEAKAVIYYMLLNFSLDVCEKTEIPLKLSKVFFAFKAENGIHLKFQPRIKA